MVNPRARRHTAGSPPTADQRGSARQVNQSACGQPTSQRASRQRGQPERGMRTGTASQHPTRERHQQATRPWNQSSRERGRELASSRSGNGIGKRATRERGQLACGMPIARDTGTGTAMARHANNDSQHATREWGQLARGMRAGTARMRRGNGDIQGTVCEQGQPALDRGNGDS